MESVPLLHCTGRRRSPATLPGYHQGRPPRNKGLRYPADPPTVEEIIAVMRATGDDPDGLRLRGLIVVLWRAGLRISEALSLTESHLDLDAAPSWFDVGRAASVARSGWTAGHGSNSLLGSWSASRFRSALFCVLRGPTRGRPSSPAGVRVQLRDAALQAGVRRRFAPHQLRHAHAVEMSREGVPLVLIQRQLGHANLGITSVILRGIDNAEIIDTVHARRAPMIPADAGLHRRI
jgi:integrase